MKKQISGVVVTILMATHVLNAADLKFATRQIRLGKIEIEVELADSEPKREQGLMKRTALAPNHGMLFVFDHPEVLVFWMKNTLIPLSIGYFDRERKLINVREMTVPLPTLPDHRLERYPSAGPAQYALEMSPGWFDKNKITPGTQFHFIN